jgi:hypothetical protein
MEFPFNTWLFVRPWSKLFARILRDRSCHTRLMGLGVDTTLTSRTRPSTLREKPHAFLDSFSPSWLNHANPKRLVRMSRRIGGERHLSLYTVNIVGKRIMNVLR